MKPSNFLIKVLDNSKCCKKIKQTDNVFNLSFQKQPCPYAREREAFLHTQCIIRSGQTLETCMLVHSRSQ